MRTQAIGAGFEGLEERLLLAGNVTSALLAGVLVLNGDVLANQVQLTVASNGQLTATGLTGTTIDGVTSKNFGVVNTLTVIGGAGDDKIGLNLTAAAIANDVTIDGGAGNDTISITGRFGANLVLMGGTELDTISVTKATVAVDLDLDSGAGNDKVTLSGSTVGHDAIIQSGIDNDSVSVSGTAVMRHLSLADSGGNNALSITKSSARGDIFVGSDLLVGGVLSSLGSGNDSVTLNGVTAGFRAGVTATGSIFIELGNGNNILSMSNSKSVGTVLGNGIIVGSGIGNDILSVVDCQSGNTIAINAGAGGNIVGLTRSITNGLGPLNITTGLGEDSVKLDRVLVGGLGIVDTGLGNDILQINNSRFTGRFTATTGDGNDTAFLSSNFFATTNSSIVGGLGIDAVAVGANSPVNNVIITFENTRSKVV